MKEKPVLRPENIEVRYNKSHWQLLKLLRLRSIEVMRVLEESNLNILTHGSIARGDVSNKSDIDIFVFNHSSSFAVEMALEAAGYTISNRYIIQATPHYVLKGKFEIGRNIEISFPLVKMRDVERNFYKFGGEINRAMLEKEKRVAGVDKRLMLIEPTDGGHIESTIIGRASEIARLLSISLETVLDRTRALLKRDRVGRTGIFIKKEVPADETFEMVLKKLSEKKPEVRRRIRNFD